MSTASYSFYSLFDSGLPMSVILYFVHSSFCSGSHSYIMYFVLYFRYV